MLTETRTAFVLTAALLLTPALAAAATHVEAPGPSLVVLEAEDALQLTAADGAAVIVLEASPDHLVLAMTGPGVLTVDGTGVVADVSPVRIRERELTVGRSPARALSLYRAVATKEENHDIDPDPKDAGRPLLTLVEVAEGPLRKEENHDIDPDPKSGWAGDWAVMSAAVASFGPGWYFVVRGGEVSYEVSVEGR